MTTAKVRKPDLAFMSHQQQDDDMMDTREDDSTSARTPPQGSSVRRKSSALDISSLLCDLPSTSVRTAATGGEDDSMDESRGDSESVSSPRPSPFDMSRATATSTPATSPPMSPMSDFDFSPREHWARGARGELMPPVQIEPGSEWGAKRQQAQQRVVLPPIRAFASLPDLRSHASHRPSNLSHTSFSPLHTSTFPEGGSPQQQQQQPPASAGEPSANGGWSQLEQLASLTDTYCTRSEVPSPSSTTSSPGYERSMSPRHHLLNLEGTAARVHHPAPRAPSSATVRPTTSAPRRGTLLHSHPIRRFHHQNT